MADEVKHENNIQPGVILPSIQEADPELVKEMDAQINNEAEPTEAGNTDKRSETSSQNGKKSGGRPHVEVDQLARDLVETHFTKNGMKLLRFYSGTWWKYKDGRYIELNETDLKSRLTGILHQAGVGKSDRINTPLVRDIVMNMQADDICGLPSDIYHPPCFIDTAKSAKGLMPMRNVVIDVEAVARAYTEDVPITFAVVNNEHKDKTPNMFITYGLDYDFTPGAECPMFMNYLEGVQPNPENRLQLQMLAGLCLVPDCSYNVAFFLYGQGGTGKSVFMKVLEELVGKDNCCSVPLSKLVDKFSLPPLTEKLVNLVGEMPVIPEGGKNADIEGTLKGITSGDIMQVERKYMNPWKAPATARMVFATNTMPAFTDRSNGVWDRLRIIPFNVVFRGSDKQNPHLAEDLTKELPGILLWAIQGLAMLRKHRTFPECEEGKAIREELREDCDHERTFLRETTVEDNDRDSGWVSTKELFEDYQKWMSNNGYYRHVGMANFKKAVRRIYPASTCEKRRTEDGNIHVFYGLKKPCRF